jgi:AAA+ ATPase superfamily predicted ATPase
VDKAKAYFVCGGIPLYLKYFSAERSVEMNITDSVLSEFAPLFREPDFLLREELRELESYYAVLLSVASGFASNQAISEQTGIGNRALYYYLQQLVELGYIGRRYPLTGEKPTQQRVRYVLEDPLLRFWFRFVYPNNSFVSQMGGERAFKDRIQPHLDSYFGGCFERLCRQALPILYGKEGVSAAFEVGAYWDKSTQIDVVGYREDGWTDLGECKWGVVRSAKDLRLELEEKVSRFPNRRAATIGRRLFTRDRVPAEPETGAAVRWHCLEDLYSD